MIEIDKIVDILSDTIKGKSDVEILFVGEKSLFVRFANSTIHQNAFFDDMHISLGVRKEGRIANVSFSSVEEEEIRRNIEKAYDMVSISPPIEDLPPTSEPFPYSSSPLVQEEIFVDKEFELVKEIIEKSPDVLVHGLLKKGDVMTIYANGKGHILTNISPVRYLKVIYEKDGMLVRKDYFTDDIEAGRIVKDLEWRIQKKGEVEIEPGKWSVILEPPAFGDLISMMGWMSLNAKSVLDGRSFFDKGKKVMQNEITILDDHSFPGGFSLPFDMEGILRQKVMLIKEGVCKNVVSDRLSAKRLGVNTTGHNAGMPGIAFPMHIVVESGSDTMEELIKNTKRGLFISYFHYINVVNPKTVTLTGMTRFGTYLIEDGEITKPVKNLRFTHSVLDALNNVVGITKEREIIGSGESYSYSIPMHRVVPGIKIEGFNFTGRTE